MDGNEQFDETPSETGIPIPPNRWLGMITRPLDILEFIFRWQPEFGVHRNFIFAGTMFALATRLPDWLAKGSHPIEVMIVLLAAGPFVGLLTGYIFTALAAWFGKMLCTVSDKSQMRTAIAWSGYVFGLAYAVFWVAYLACYILRPDPVERYIIGTSTIGWIPLVLGGSFFLFALWTRWRSMAYTLQSPLPKAIVCWIGAFIFSYVPVGILILAYFGLYTKSLEWIISG